MKNTKIKVLEKNPMIRIDTNWFPYKESVNKSEFEKICRCIELAIELHGAHKVHVSYDVMERDHKGNPLVFMIKCKTKSGFLTETEGLYPIDAIRKV